MFVDTCIGSADIFMIYWSISTKPTLFVHWTAVNWPSHTPAGMCVIVMWFILQDSRRFDKNCRSSRTLFERCFS